MEFVGCLCINHNWEPKGYFGRQREIEDQYETFPEPSFLTRKTHPLPPSLSVPQFAMWTEMRGVLARFTPSPALT
jgi:hypothetical protein